MSAFHDIYISNENNPPLSCRSFNRNWQQTGFVKNMLWESKPQHIDKSCSFNVETNTHRLIVIGQFYEKVDNIALLKHCVSFVNGSAHTFNDPAGNYIIFLIEKNEGGCHILTDRFGTHHAYYSTEAGRKAISTYYLGLAKQSVEKKLDWDAITGFLAMGYFPSDSTYSDNIKVMLPASYYSFDKELNLVKTKRYWDWQYQPSTYSVSNYLEEFDAAIKSSLTFALKDRNIALPISGGLDSRTLAGLIQSLEGEYKNVWSYSYGFSSKSPEIAIARQIAESSQFSFNSYVVPDYLFDEMDIIANSVELFQYVDGTRQVCMKEELQSKSDVVVGGHWGDVWFNNMSVGEGDNLLLSDFSKKIVKKGSNILLDMFSEYTTSAVPSINAHFTDYIGKYNHIKDNSFRFKIYKTDQWSFRWTLSSIRAYQSAVTTVLPFYDKNVVDVLTRAPEAMHTGRQLQIQYLKKYYPALAGIKWQEYNSNLYKYKWLNNRNLIYRAVKKAQRTLASERQLIRNADIFYLNTDGRRKLQSVFDNAHLNDIIPQHKITALMDNYYKNPSAENTYAVSMLHTFAQFINRVF